MLDSLYTFIRAHEPLLILIGVLLAAIALVAPVFITRYSTYSLREEVADPSSWPTLLERYGQSRSVGYFAAIGWFLDWTDGFYGDRLLGPAARNRCLAIAMIYPLIALMSGWVLFDAHTLGGFPVLPEGLDIIIATLTLLIWLLVTRLLS